MEPLSLDAGFVHGTVTLNVAGQRVTISAEPILSPPAWPNPSTATASPPAADGYAARHGMDGPAYNAVAPGDRVQNLLELLQKFGPFILSVLKLLGVKASPLDIAAALQAYHAING